MNLNKKGFTLIELIAMLVVLGILMAVTIPNITGILSQSKTNILKEDVNKMVDTAKVKMATDKKIKKPKENECLVLTLEYLDDNDEFKKGPNDGVYEREDSFVIVKRDRNQYKYYVRLIEEVENNKHFGVAIVDYDKFQKTPEKSIESEVSSNLYYGSDRTLNDALSSHEKIIEHCKDNTISFPE